MNDERRKGEGNTLETSPFTHTQLSLATSKGGMWRRKIKRNLPLTPPKGECGDTKVKVKGF